MSNDIIEIVLPGIPRGKGRPRFGNGRAYTDAATASFEGALRLAGVIAMNKREPLRGALSMMVEAHFPVPQSWPKSKKENALRGLVRPTGKPDCDNILKGVDALNQIVWIDDAQLVGATVVKLYSATPQLKIVVWPVL